MRQDFTQAEIDALPEYSIADHYRAVTDPVTGRTSRERITQTFVARVDAGVLKDGHGDCWLVFTDTDGLTWKTRIE